MISTRANEQQRSLLIVRASVRHCE